MTNENKYNINGGVGFAGLLSLLFITLKLCDKIDWSWWWVLSPLWIPVGFVLSIGMIVLVLYKIFK
ncbi:hypothetical protein KAI04_04310 [Candidatus Pacearchaeota archaeon]|nr:hypothetical protein [Candidatus Pacearchaeota archaeon]